ncbi:serine protease Do [Mobilisporobacter senegalensis]|uniref:Serine protease Do n=1 Tax=Mobilisporobacter senegalensis TaxID=1329262 RepID=A0A3N1XPG7_9FIRM|nr:trypsin-like peptidase domain-containing protein [Mobilisporobacter senegalensis]ROR28148.1 serine protease Do [Mobilisporobacter senegalensis]
MNNEYENRNNEIEYYEYIYQELDSDKIDKEETFGGSSKEGKGKRDPRRLHSFMKIASTALVFGLVAGTTFQGFNYASNKLLNQNTSSNSKINESTTLGNTNSSSPVVKTNTNSSQSGEVAQVVENVMPSIVSISITATQNVSDFFGRIYEDQATGSGSGIIIGQNNKEVLIATNNHVVEGADTVTITFVDDTTAEATVKGTAASSDLAVVSVDLNSLSEETKSNIKIATLGNSDSLKVGEMAIAIGNALGYGQSVTVGYISALEREVSVEDSSMKLLQTDAAINPGNSGGALLNSKGEVIGINSVKYASEEVEGMGYAIPISDAIPIVTQLMNQETIPESEQAYLGIMGTDITSDVAKSYKMPEGVYVGEVSKNSPAHKAGLTQGSIITELNGRDATSMEKLQEILTSTRAGEKVTLVIKVLENGEYVEKTLDITLGSKAQAK